MRVPLVCMARSKSVWKPLNGGDADHASGQEHNIEEHVFQNACIVTMDRDKALRYNH
jgi:hypothetical protein